MNGHDEFMHEDSLHEDPSRSDLLIQVCTAFERMPIPPGPSRAETIELVTRAVAHEETTDLHSRPRWRSCFSTRRRVALAGASVAAAVVLAVIVVNTAQPLSAMERMVRQLRAVKSYRYMVSTKTTSVDGATTSSWVGEGPTYWRAPAAFRDEMKIVKTIVGEGSGERREEVLEDFVQSFPAGKPGIFIDRKRRAYFRAPFDPIGSRTYPLEMLKLVREGNSTPTRDLGRKTVQGKLARGYVVPLTTGEPPRRHDIEVWIDLATDLPLEFGYRVADKQSGMTTEFRVSDFRWNVELDPKLFDVPPPAGYVEREPPRSSGD